MAWRGPASKGMVWSGRHAAARSGGGFILDRPTLFAPTPASGITRALAVAKTTIRVFRVGEYDWVVQEDGGRDLGHYPTQSNAESVGRTLARARRAVLLVEDRKGRPKRTDFSGLWRRLFGR
jgi:hypothetical protein